LQVYLLGTLEWLVLADKWTVRYHMDEDPKCLKVFSIPLQDGKGSAAHYDRLAVSPNNQVLAATHGSTLQWLRAETGEVLDTAENAHDGEITCLTWSPQPLPTGKINALHSILLSYN
jgi:WD40 repeat protein